MRLLRAFTSFLVNLIAWAATDKSYAASGWHIDAMYAPLAR